MPTDNQGETTEGAVEEPQDAGGEPEAQEAPASQEQQISEMLGDFSSTVPDEDGVEELESSEEEVTQQQTEEEPVQITEPEPEPEPEPEAEETEPDLRSEIQSLRQELAELRGQKQEESGEPEAQEPEAQEQEVPQEVLNMVSQEQHDMILSDPEAFNELIGALYTKIRQDVIRDIPQLVSKTAQRQTAYQTAIKDFWSRNSDLKEHMDFVRYTANKVQSDNPNASVEKALSMTEQRVREQLNIKERAEKREGSRKQMNQGAKKDPSFARKPRGQRQPAQQEQKSEQQKQIDEILDL